MGTQTCHLDLWEAFYSQNKPVSIRNKLVLENMGLVHQICNRAKHLQSFQGIEYDELVQVGTLGLISAVDRFQLESGRYFYAFAYPFVEGRLRQYLRDKCRLIRFPVNKYDMVMAWQRTLDKLQQSLNHNPTFMEVYEALPEKHQGKEKEFWLDVLQSWRQTYTLHDTLDLSLMDMIPDTKEEVETRPLRQVPREVIQGDARIMEALRIVDWVERGKLKSKGDKGNGQSSNRLQYSKRLCNGRAENAKELSTRSQHNGKNLQSRGHRPSSESCSRHDDSCQRVKRRSSSNYPFVAEQLHLPFGTV
jgi:RNA polymerase sigma factor (sigma-70 family)